MIFLNIDFIDVNVFQNWPTPNCQESNGLFVHKAFHQSLDDLTALLVRVFGRWVRLESFGAALKERVLPRVCWIQNLLLKEVMQSSTPASSHNFKQKTRPD